jgi:hypothetical protein
VPQVLSTLHRTLGIDPAQALPNGDGPPLYLLGGRDPVAELI